MSLRGTKCRGNPASGLLHSLRSFAMTLVLAWRLCLCCRLMHDAGLTSRVSDAGCHCEARSAAAIQTLPGEGLDERDEGDNEPAQDEHGDGSVIILPSSLSYSKSTLLRLIPHGAGM